MKKVVLKDLDENVEKLTLDKDTDKLENITRDIEYITSNKNGIPSKFMPKTQNKFKE